MKLSKIILENKKFIVREQIELSNKDIERLSESIAVKLEDYLDLDNNTDNLLKKTIAAAITELTTQETIQLFIIKKVLIL